MKKNKRIRKSFDSVEVKFNRSSCDTVSDFRKKKDVNGNSVYVKVGEHSLSNYINSFKNACSLEAILQRCSLMPITDKVKILQQVPAVSADMTQFPKDLTDAFVRMTDLRTRYPDISKRVSAGESIDSIIKSISKKEINTNVDTKSSND